MKKACVIGFPAKHSLSPFIHGYWLEKYAIEGSYEIKEVQPEKFEDFFCNLQQQGFIGCNITLPFKEKAYELVKKMQGDLGVVENAMQAINTVSIKNGKYIGRNTDGIGFVSNINQCADIDFGTGKIIILGAGGAARAVIVGLIQAGAKQILLLNRTIKKAEKIKQEMAKLFPLVTIEVFPWEQQNTVQKDAVMLVNTTSLGMVGQGPLDIELGHLPQTALVTDIVYRPLITDLLRQAKDHGNKVVGGLGMLLYQGVPGFEMWFGTKPEVTSDLKIKIEARLT